MKYLLMLFFLALCACAEPENERPAVELSAGEPDTTGGVTMPIDTTWDAETTVNF